MGKKKCNIDKKLVGAVGRWAKPWYQRLCGLPTMKKCKWAEVGAVGENVMPTFSRPLAHLLKTKVGEIFYPVNPCVPRLRPLAHFAHHKLINIFLQSEWRWAA